MILKINLTPVVVVKKIKMKLHANAKGTNIWKLSDREIEGCESYKYLGVTIKSNDSSSEHIHGI